MGTIWKPIRVSAETYARLQEMRDRMVLATEAGVAYPRQQFESLTLDVVIATLLDRDADHRRRGRKYKQLQKKVKETDTMYTCDAASEPNGEKGEEAK